MTTYPLPDFENIRVVSDNDQTTGYTQNGVVEDNYISVQGPNVGFGGPRWVWATSAGGGDDIFDIRSGTKGILRGDDGRTVYLVREGAFGDFLLGDFDLETDVIVVEGDQSIEDFRLVLDRELRIGNVRLTSDYSLDEFEAAGALLRYDEIEDAGVPDGLEDIGDDFAEAGGFTDLSSFGFGDPDFGDGPDRVDINRTDFFSGNLGFGADAAFLTGTGGGYIGLGGVDPVAATSVYTAYTNDRISLPGSPGRPDGDPDTVIVTPLAEGEWNIGQIDDTDRIVLYGFDGIETLSDLQLLAFETETTSTRYDLTPGLSLAVPMDATQMVLVAGSAARGDGRIAGGDGDDILIGSAGADVITGEAGADRLLGGDGTDRINGGDGDDTILGGDTEADRRDEIFGGAGDDAIDAGHGNDTVYGQDGDDTIAGGFGADELQGQAGNDTLTGSALSDLVYGGDGNDFVNGGFGFDRINGGRGADKFYHLGIADHGSDWIQDYSAAEGDVLAFGNAAASAADFVVRFAHTSSPATGRSGADDVQEAFVTYRPSGQIIWALIDGAGEARLNVEIGGELFDLLG